MKKILPFLLFSILSFPLLAGQFNFSGYSIEQGLSQSVVNCVFQDSKGYIWLGTQNGLNKFNGNTFEVFTHSPSDSGSISNNWIYAITEDKDGNLWIGTKGGLNKFIRNKKRFQRILYKTPFRNTVLTEYVYDVKVAENGNLIINTAPVLTIYSPKENKFTCYVSSLKYDRSVKDNNVPLLISSNGQIWMGASNGLSCFDPKTASFRYFIHDEMNENSIVGNNITALCEDSQGHIWIGTSSGLNCLDPASGTIRKFISDKRIRFALNNNFIRSIINHKNTGIWIGTEGGGLYKYSLDKQGIPVFENFTKENSGLCHNIVLSLFVDRSENLWIGTLQGLSKTDLKPAKFLLYQKNDKPASVDLLGNIIASIYKDGNEIIWIGNWGQGLNLFNRKTGQVEHFSSKLTGNHFIPNDYVHVIFADSEKRIWIGTRDGILIFRESENRFVRMNDFFKSRKIPRLEGIRVNRIMQDKNRNYWISTQNGLYKFDLSGLSVDFFSTESIPEHRISSNQVYCVLNDNENLIWIATVNGLDLYNPLTNKMRHYRSNPANANSLCDNFVTSLCEDRDGNIWIGTNSYVNKFVKMDSTFRYYSKESGLPNNLIYEILEDKNKDIWFSTGNGIAKYIRRSDSFRTYSVDDGLQSVEFNLGAAFKCNDGELFFGGMKGVNAFYPDKMADNQYIPDLAFTSFYCMKGGMKQFIDIDTTNTVILKYNENNFTIEFSALEYTNPEKNSYSFFMEGVSDDWIQLGNRRFVPFTNLQPGKYTFKIKCTNNDGIRNDTAKQLVIIVKPPWWKSNLAYVFYILIILFSIFLYVKLREKHLLKDRKLLEQRVKERTLQIEEQTREIQAKNEELRELNATKDKFFSIISHDLRGPFNSILGTSDLLLNDFQTYDKTKLRSSLSNIKISSKQAYELLENLLLWSRSQTGGLVYNPVEFNLKDVIDENIELLNTQAQNKNIEVISEITKDCRIFGDLNMIDTVIRNLLNNAIKFTGNGGRVLFSSRATGNECEISVEDTGVGIAPEKIHRLLSIDTKHITKGTSGERGSGLGLVLCNEFIQKHGGRLWVESEVGVGSRIRFTLPGKVPDSGKDTEAL